MPGRIRDDDIALVRERSNIAEIVAEHVTLRNAGGGSLKGLCPFHDERTPSFQVSPARGFFHCFGCGEGGDVISFVMKIDHLAFAEAVERLAARAGVQLRYEEGGYTPRQQQGQRTRLIDAHKTAAEFYAEQLLSAEAAAGRAFLSERGFDRAAAERFGVGFSPRGWDLLVRHLRARGYRDDELVAGGLAMRGQRGLIDRFRGRLMWPIRDITGDVVGFGARRLFDDDRAEAKYLNTADSPIFHKSTVLYGLDLAKREIARQSRVVVVEGYTDVMACHLSGVQTAVATCGTAFGDEHIKTLRRVLNDRDEYRSEVVFTFDGDAAGQKAALRAFEGDQKFVAQTFVAVEPDGLDPCEVRQTKGPEAVRALVERRVPLFEFVVRTAVRRHDLDTAEGRVAALRAGVPIVARIKDSALRDEYARRLGGWVGVADELDVVAQVRRQARFGGRAGDRPGGRAAPRPGARPEERDAGQPTATSGAGSRRPAVLNPSGAATPPGVPAARRPDPADPAMLLERELLKVVVQSPEAAPEQIDGLTAQVFTAPAYAAVWEAVVGAGGPRGRGPGPEWISRVREAAADDLVRGLVAELAVEPLRTDEPVGRYAAVALAAVRERAIDRQIAELRSRLQRLQPAEDPPAYSALFADLLDLERRRRGLRETALGG